MLVGGLNALATDGSLEPAIVIEEPIIIEEPSFEIEEQLAERWESFFDQITSAVATVDSEDEWADPVYDISKAHQFVVADENLINYDLVNSNLGEVGNGVAEASNFLKEVNLSVDSSIGGGQHKWIVETMGPWAAAWFPYTLNFDFGASLENLENNSFDIQSVEIGFGSFQTAADPRAVTAIFTLDPPSYVNKVYLDFEVSLDSLEVFSRVLEIEEVMMACAPEAQELIIGDLPELAPVLGKGCALAEAIRAAETFPAMLTTTKPMFQELDTMVDETISKLLEDQGDAISTLVKIATDVSIEAKTCERWSREWWETPLPEWKDWFDFEFTGCQPSVRVELGGGAIFAGGQAALTISEKSLKFDVITTVNDENLGAFTDNGLDEAKAEAMSYFWAAMKTAETLTPEEKAYASSGLAELFDEAVGYMVEDLDDEVRSELD